jgi:hypothetical protein
LSARLSSPELVLSVVTLQILVSLLLLPSLSLLLLPSLSLLLLSLLLLLLLLLLASLELLFHRNWTFHAAAGRACSTSYKLLTPEESLVLHGVSRRSR